MSSLKMIIGPALLALVCTIATGCGGGESGDTVRGSATQPASVDTALAEEVEALPTVEEAQEQAVEQIDEDNVDEALRQLEAELDE